MGLRNPGRDLGPKCISVWVVALPITPVGRKVEDFFVYKEFVFLFLYLKKKIFLGASLPTSSSFPQAFSHLKAVDLTLYSLSNKFSLSKMGRTPKPCGCPFWT